MDQTIRIGDRFRPSPALDLGAEVRVEAYADMPHLGTAVSTSKGKCFISDEFLLNPACFTRIGSTRLPEIPE